MTTVLVAGIAVYDIVYQLANIPNKPLKYKAEKMQVVSGGCAANAAVTIAKLDGNPILVTRVGQDIMGEKMLIDLRSEGVDCSHSRISEDGITPLSSVCVDQNGERQIVNFPGHGLAHIPGYLTDAVAQSSIVLVDTRWADAAQISLKLAKEHGISGVIDAEPPFPGGILELASHVVFSWPGLKKFTGLTEIKAALIQADQDLPGWVAVTDGRRGCYYINPAGLVHENAFKVKVVDTLAAGDVWHGAFALSLGEGESEVNAVRFANAVAALKCTGFGGRSAIPNRLETNTFLQKQK